jgi:hypothetical protein
MHAKTDSKDKKRKPYSPPTLTKLTPKEAKQLVTGHIDSSDQDVVDFLEAMRRQQQDANEDEPTTEVGERWKRSA